MIDQQAALRAARSLGEKSSVQALLAENVMLKDEKKRLQKRFDVSQDLARIAIDRAEKAEAEAARLRRRHGPAKRIGVIG